MIENGGSGTKPAYKFMLISALLAIELKATPNDNPTNDICWRQKSSSLNVMQINTTSRPIIFTVHCLLFIYPGLVNPQFNRLV